MPVEIRELVIRATVQGGDSAESDDGCDGTPALGAGSSAGDPRRAAAGNSAGLEACVEEVLKILARKKER